MATALVGAAALAGLTTLRMRAAAPVTAPGSAAPDSDIALAADPPIAAATLPLPASPAAVTPTVHAARKPDAATFKPASHANAGDGDPARIEPQDELRIARRKIELRLYDQALETLRQVATASDHRRDAIEAWFLIASIDETRDRTDDAMSAYLEVASRYPDDPRAAEALYRMAQATLASKRRDREVDARRMLTDVVEKYPTSAWAPRALMARAGIEEREDLHQHDDLLGRSVPSSLMTYREIVERYRSSAPAAQAGWKLARAYVEVKRFDLAAAVYESLGARDIEHRDEAWFYAGDLYEKHLKDLSRARRAFSRILPSSPHYSEAQKHLRQ